MSKSKPKTYYAAKYTYTRGSFAFGKISLTRKGLISELEECYGRDWEDIKKTFEHISIVKVYIYEQE